MLSRREFRRMYAPPKHTPTPTDHGVFVWRLDGRYVRADAVNVYRSEATAQRHADRLNAGFVVGQGYVVRTLTREG